MVWYWAWLSQTNHTLFSVTLFHHYIPSHKLQPPQKKENMKFKKRIMNSSKLDGHQYITLDSQRFAKHLHSPCLLKHSHQHFRSALEIVPNCWKRQVKVNRSLPGGSCNTWALYFDSSLYLQMYYKVPYKLCSNYEENVKQQSKGELFMNILINIRTCRTNTTFDIKIWRSYLNISHFFDHCHCILCHCHWQCFFSHRHTYIRFFQILSLHCYFNIFGCTCKMNVSNFSNFVFQTLFRCTPGYFCCLPHLVWKRWKHCKNLIIIRWIAFANYWNIIWRFHNDNALHPTPFPNALFLPRSLTFV